MHLLSFMCLSWISNCRLKSPFHACSSFLNSSHMKSLRSDSHYAEHTCKITGHWYKNMGKHRKYGGNYKKVEATYKHWGFTTFVQFEENEFCGVTCSAAQLFKWLCRKSEVKSFGPFLFGVTERCKLATSEAWFMPLCQIYAASM